MGRANRLRSLAVVCALVGAVGVWFALRKDAGNPASESPSAPVVAAPPAVEDPIAEPIGPVDFNLQIRPILSEHCYACHGPADEGRKAGLRLDRREDALAVLEPKNPEASPFLARIASADEDRMPPRHTGKSLTAEQIELLRRWVKEGASYRTHWAYVTPVSPPVPKVRNAAWVRNPIDAFILARLEREGLSPSPEADRAALIRRLSLALTGLPPTPAEIDLDLGDTAAGADKRVIDRLLASPHYGERMASTWLDLARYADTNGGTTDHGREMWMWRDWVVAAFNDNMRFDRFTVEQLAGDLLPDRKFPQILATGFLRNEPLKEEICEDQNRAFKLTDRVNTVGAVWLGSTTACSQCHDHKYDPLTQRDYYRMLAFFNDLPKKPPAVVNDPRGNLAPVLSAPTAAQSARLESLREQLARANSPAEKKRLESEIESIRGDTLTAMIMEEPAEKSDTHVLIRGEYDRKGPKVSPGVPNFLPPLADSLPADRLGFAKWLVAPNHPLTARVAVNRIWQHHFGTGLVATPEDFGLQGELPSHPELLDWLAVRFVESGWNVKAMHALIVESATYRQTSRAPKAMRERDPENRLLARGPRFRLPAETIRDNTLAIGGLLNRRMGGPAVKPYQPVGLWEAIRHPLAFTAQDYVQSRGTDLHRRGVYVFWKRTMPHPSMSLFDAPSRDVCVVRRPRTNTALQALIQLNDPTVIESSRGLAFRMMAEGGENRLAYGFRVCTGRWPKPAEHDVLKRIHQAESERFRNDRAAAEALLAVGESAIARDLDPPEVAALAVVANLLLNLDETLSLE